MFRVVSSETSQAWDAGKRYVLCCKRMLIVSDEISTCKLVLD